MRATPLVAVAVCALALGGCSNMSERDQRILSGGAIGAGIGTVTTVMTGGCVTCGAAIGGAVGAAAGYIYDKMENDKKE